jgi:hypothetical protein
MIPAVISAMQIFPVSSSVNNLEYGYDANTDVFGLLSLMVQPSSIGNGIHIVLGPIDYTLSIQFTLTAIIGLLVVVSLARSSSTPAIVAGIIGVLVIPFIIDVGWTFKKHADMYNSAPLTLMIVAIIAGLVVLGIITVLETPTQGDVSE